MTAPADSPAGADRTAAQRAYYEASTGRFLAFGGSGRSLAIHRGLWSEGVTDSEAAAAEINRRIAATLARMGVPAPARVRDLGCGVGGSLFHFAEAWPEAMLEGVTLSPRQARMGMRIARDRGLAGRVTIRCANYLDAPEGPPADLAAAIESHVHAPSAAVFMRAARAGLARGGHLALADDMLARPAATLDARAARRLDAFRRGWHLGHVPDAEGLKAAAAAAGLACRHDEDLTPLIRLDRWRDRVLRHVAPLADAAGLGRWPLFANMIGGNALTEGYRDGVMRYRLMIFEAL